MPLPRGLAEFNRRATNRLARRFAGRLSPFVMLVHHGRISGSLYETPLMAFRVRDGYAIALTYGAGADWVRNVLAAGGGSMIRGGRFMELTEPRVIQGEAAVAPLPALVRFVLRRGKIDECLWMRPVWRGDEGRA